MVSDTNNRDDVNGSEDSDAAPAYHELMRTLSHELRTPLSTIIGFADIMENEMMGALGNTAYREYATDIHKAARHILDTLNDLAESARFSQFKSSQNDFRHIIELAPDLISICREGKIEMINPAGLSMLGHWSTDNLNGQALYDFVHPDDQTLLQPDLLDLSAERLRLPLKLLRKDGLEVHVEIAAVPYDDGVDDDPRTHGRVMVIARDVTQRNRAISDAAERSDNLWAVMDAVADGIVATDEQGLIDVVNPAIESMFGYTANSLIGQHIGTILPAMRGIGLKLYVDQKNNQYTNLLLERDIEESGLHQDGRTVPVEAVISATTGSKRQQYICAIRDITARKSFEDRLRTLATRDILTGLANRNLLSERLQNAMHKVNTFKGQFALMYVDLDQFQNINDAFGHETGDEVIKLASRRLLTCVRANDTVARVGGDEFHILLADIQNEAEALKMAQDFLNALSSPYMIDGREIYSSASIGVGLYPAHGDSVSTLMRNVDTAANTAKRNGRATCKLYLPSMSDEVHRRVELGHQLRRALENNELSLHYQAKVDLTSQRILGAEALLRWYSDSLGFVSPVEFIPVAEETGLIVPIGEWVLQTACMEAAQWRAPDGRPIQVGVNLSALQFSHGDLVARTRQCLDASGLSPSNLDLELTESLLVERPDETIFVLKKLKDMGISISMDDFGTGYSSLSYLTKFPLDSLKVDRAFVTDLPDSHDAMVVVRAIVGMAKQLDLHIVAEGIETQEQMEFLHELGCHTGQGYFFSKPLPKEECLRTIGMHAAE